MHIRIPFWAIPLVFFYIVWAEFRRTVSRDLVFAYLLSFVRVAAWVLVLGLVSRRLGEQAFAFLAAVKTVAAFWNHAAWGLAAALPVSLALDDHAPRDWAQSRRITLIGFAAGTVALAVYAVLAPATHQTSLPDATLVAASIAGATLLRVAGDRYTALQQARGRFWLENLLLAAELAAWAAASAVLLLSGQNLLAVGVAAVVCAGLTLAARFLAARGLVRTLPPSPHADVAQPPAGDLATPNPETRPGIVQRMSRSLPGRATLVTIANAADLLYAPACVLLITHWLTPGDLAAYSTLLFFDAALLLAVGAMSAVALGWAARMSADARLLRRLFLTMTAASVGVMLIAGAALWLAGPWLTRAWLGHASSTATAMALLPWALANAIAGAAAGPARGVLLGSGKFWPWMTSVVLGGIANVAAAAVALAAGTGLRGMLIAVLAVTALRCGIVLPAMVLHATRRKTPADIAPTTAGR